MSSQSSTNAAEQHSDATACSSGSASANSGGNSSAGGIAGERDGEDDAEHNGVSSAADVSEGDAKAQGVAHAEKITQNAWVTADATSKVDVLQVALVINIGFAIANTAGNSATGVSGPKLMSVPYGLAFNPGSGSLKGQASVTTGGATGAGVVSNTRILQAAVVRSEVGEDKQSVENALVINLGEGTANTGLNKVIGVLSKHGEDYGIGGAAGTASIETGGATAVGVASSTLITQTVQAHATDGAFIVITQKGVVLNVGGALANTGFNSATGVGALGLTGEQLAALTSLYQVLNALLEAGGWALPADGGAGGGSGNAVGDAQVSTGDALAVGADAVTTIIQDANATADGGTVDASQSAVVANVGLGVANTGGNRAAGVSGGGAEEPEEPEESEVMQESFTSSPAAQRLADFLLALSGGVVAPDGTTEVAGLFDFGPLVATLTGHAEITDSLLEGAPTDLLEGDESSEEQTTGVRVRQVIGVLTFAFSSANGNVEVETDGDTKEQLVETDEQAMSTANQIITPAARLADQTVAGASTSESSSVGNPPDPSTFEADVTGSAEIETGDAVAGNVARTRICQVHNVDPEICVPKVIRWIVNPTVSTIITRTTVRVQQVTVPKVALTPSRVAVPSGVRSAVSGAEDDAAALGGGETLPVTGADSTDNLTIAWSFVGAGVFLVLVAALVPRRRAIG